VRCMAGSIEAKSEGPGKGSEFIVLLPCMRKERHPARQFPASGVALRRRRGAVFTTTTTIATDSIAAAAVRLDETWSRRL